MSVSPSLVVIDTTEFFKALRLDRAGWPQLLAWSRQGVVDVAVPAVVLHEANRHFSRDRLAELGELRKAAKKFEDPKTAVHLALTQVEAVVQAEVDSYLGWAQAELEAHRVEIWPIPQVSHEDLLRRDLGERKPFSSSGKGYRDTLIWETVLEHLPDPDDRAIYIVTRNSSDFASKDGALHPDLVAEAKSKGAAVQRLDSISVAVELLREAAEKQLQLLARRDEARRDAELTDRVAEAVATAAERLIGTPIFDDDFGSSLNSEDLGIPSEITESEIVHVEPSKESVVLDVYDRFDGDTLAMTVSIEATASIDGFVEKADYYASLQDDVDVDIYDADWNEHVMLVHVSRELVLQFNVMVVGTSIEDITLDTVRSA